MDRDHTPPQAGLRVPDPLFTTTIPAGRRSRPISCPVPLPPGGQPDHHHSSTGSGTNFPQERQRGRHRRAWLSWLWPQFPPVPVQKVTLEDLRRWLSHERAYVPRPRRIVVLPRQRFAPDVDAPVTSTNTVPYQGATPPRAHPRSDGGAVHDLCPWYPHRDVQPTGQRPRDRRLARWLSAAPDASAPDGPAGHPTPSQGDHPPWSEE